MSKALIYVTIVTNKCVDRLWKTDIGTVEYSIATTFRSTGADTILYWKYRTVPYTILFTLIHMFQRIMGIEWIMISVWQYGLACTALVWNCTIVQHHYVTGTGTGNVLSSVIIFVNLKYCHFGFIYHLRSRILGTVGSCVIEKRELLVLLHKSVEIRYRPNVGYYMETSISCMRH